MHLVLCIYFCCAWRTLTHPLRSNSRPNSNQEAFHNFSRQASCSSSVSFVYISLLHLSIFKQMRASFFQNNALLWAWIVSHPLFSLKHLPLYLICAWNMGNPQCIFSNFLLQHFHVELVPDSCSDTLVETTVTSCRLPIVMTAPS